jgi:hypothetical protein
MSETQRRTAAAILGTISWLRKRLDAEEVAAKELLALLPGEKIAVNMPGAPKDSPPIGFISMVSGRRSVYVYDWDLLAKWAKARYPGSVKMTVDPVWWELISKDILKRGALIDADGEVCEHVTITQGNPFTQTKLDLDTANAVMPKLWQDKVIQFDPLDPKAITAKVTPRKRTAK